MMFLCLLAQAGWAQPEKGTFTLQPKVGLTMSTFSGNLLRYDAKWHVGMTAGVETEWQFANEVSLISGLTFRRQGCGFNEKEHYAYDGKIITSELNSLTLDYLCLPIMLGVRAAKRLNLRFGVEFCYTLSAKLRQREYGRVAENTDNNVWQPGMDESLFVWHKVSNRYSVDAKDEFKAMSLNIPLGLSYEFRNVLVNLTYHLELLRATGGSIFENDEPFEYPHIEKKHLTNHCIELTAGYKFAL